MFVISNMDTSKRVPVTHKSKEKLERGLLVSSEKIKHRM